MGRFVTVVKTSSKISNPKQVDQLILRQRKFGKGVKNNKSVNLLRRRTVNTVRAFYLQAISEIGRNLRPNNPFGNAWVSGTTRIPVKVPKNLYSGDVTISTRPWEKLNDDYHVRKPANTIKRFWARRGFLYDDYLEKTNKSGTELVQLDRRKSQYTLKSKAVILRYSIHVQSLPEPLGTFVTQSFLQQRVVNPYIKVRTTKFTYRGKGRKGVFGVQVMAFAEATPGTRERLHRPFVGQLAATMGQKMVETLTKARGKP